MAKWASIKNQQLQNMKNYDETHDLIMGHVIIQSSQKPGNELIQNCDLPPPVKVFSKSDNRAVMMNSRKKCISNLSVVDQEEIDDGDGKLGVLKALRLSQTRAREAEAKYMAAVKERDSLACAFINDCMQVYAYRQLVKLLDFQVSQLQEKQQMMNHVCCDCDTSLKNVEDGDDDDGDGSNGLSWLLTVAFCLGIAGIGVAIGCKFYWY